MNIDEFAVGGDCPKERELTEDEIQQAMEADPEGILITNYLTNSLSPEERAEVEHRLREDEGFRARVEPLIAAWNAWPTIDDFTISDEERDASFRQFLVKWGAHEHAREVAKRREYPRVPRLVREHDPADDQRRRRQLRGWQLAAALLAMLSIGGIPTAAWLGFRASERMQPPATYNVEAAARESRMVTVGKDVMVSLDPGSRLTWSEVTGPNGATEMFLDGSARVIAPTAIVGHNIVVTASGRINLNGATATIDATDLTVTRVEVMAGSVVVESRSNQNHDLVFLNAGEKGMAIHNQAPRRVR